VASGVIDYRYPCIFKSKRRRPSALGEQHRFGAWLSS
jgi:hypothetical protein